MSSPKPLVTLLCGVLALLSADVARGEHATGTPLAGRTAGRRAALGFARRNLADRGQVDISTRPLIRTTTKAGTEFEAYGIKIDGYRQPLAVVTRYGRLWDIARIDTVDRVIPGANTNLGNAIGNSLLLRMPLNSGRVFGAQGARVVAEGHTRSHQNVLLEAKFPQVEAGAMTGVANAVTGAVNVLAPGNRPVPMTRISKTFIR